MADVNQASRASSFRTTCWTDVLSARAESPDAEQGFSRLYSDYWPPMYAYLRRRGLSASESEEITQDFFVTLLEKDRLARIKREGGRFRSFLLTSMQHFLAQRHQKAAASKRGGGATTLSMDEMSTEPGTHYPQQGIAPELLYDRDWAALVLQRSITGLKQEYEEARKGHLFSILATVLQGDKGGRPYPQLAEELGMTEGAVKVAIHRLRYRYGEIVREEISRTVASPSEVQDEIRHLLQIISA